MSKPDAKNEDKVNTEQKDVKTVRFSTGRYDEDDITPHEIEELKAAFRVFDKDVSGVIDPRKLGAVMKTLGQNPTEAEVQDLIAAIDESGSGTINFSEFKSMMVPKLREPDKLEDTMESFKVFDRDGKGYIALEDLENLFSKLGYGYTRLELQDMLKAADLDGDRRVTLQDFLEALKDPKD